MKNNVRNKISLVSFTCLNLYAMDASAACDFLLRNNSATSTSQINSADDNFCLENAGTMTMNAQSSIVSTGAGAEISNSGAITVTGDERRGIVSTGANSAISNSGTITTSGRDNFALHSTGANAVISDSGTIKTAGDGGHGIYPSGANAVISNAGVIRATGANANAIRVEGTNATVNLLRGSVIEGALFTNQTDSVLNIKVGAGASYAFQTTGDWTTTDLDNRPMVKGSAYAAGIGAQEAAAQMLY